MNVSALVLTAILAAGQTAPDRTGTAQVPGCVVRLIEEAEVPAQEPGVLKRIFAREGQAVRSGEVLAEIDDAKTRAELAAAQSKLKVALEKAKDDINVRFAKAACEVAEAEYKRSERANRAAPGAVPEAKMNELKLEWKKEELSIDKAKLDYRVAGFEAEGAEAEVAAALENIQRHKIKSPLDGVVVTVHRHEGEWVQPGDQVLHVIHMDRLWVDGDLNAKDYLRAEVDGRPVTVTVKLAHGRSATLDGKVVFASPKTDSSRSGGTFLVRSEVKNEFRDGHWLLNPGMSASVSIQLK